MTVFDAQLTVCGMIIGAAAALLHKPNSGKAFPEFCCLIQA